MKQYSFLTESRKKFIKRLLRYTPEEREKIRQALISNGRHGLNRNGAYMKGMYSADEYGRRAFEGQKTRMRKLASKNGIKDFKIKDRRNTDVLSGEMFGDNEISLPAITNPANSSISPSLKKDVYNYFVRMSKRNPTTLTPEQLRQYGKPDSTYFRRVKKSLAKPSNDNVSVPLTGYTVANHEADEFSSALKLAKKYGLSIDDAIEKFRNSQARNIGSHNPGVLRRERNLYKDLSLMYGRNSFFRMPRSKVEVRANS